VALLLMAASCLCAQEKPSAEADKSSPFAQTVKRDYRFEVASIRRVDFTGWAYGDPRSKPHFDPGLYRNEQLGLVAWVLDAFELKHPYQLEAPHWMSNEYFTINASPPEGTTNDDVPIMLRHLLEDRFGLKYHHETRQMAGYQLVVAKSGSRLTKSPAPASERKLVRGMPEMKNGVPQFAKNSGSGFIGYRDIDLWRGRNETMERLTEQLADRLETPVADATGLEGEYDYDLVFTPDLHNPTAGGDASEPTGHPLLRDALREQLGLELRPVKNVSIDVLVIDGATKDPTEN
jgi:uncharacterized protein (TIGR03435 family)